MSIVAGTDFSNNARAAAHAAAALARRLGTELKLAHVHDELGASPGDDARQALLLEGRRRALDDHAAELARAFGITVDPVFELGDAERTLAELCERFRAELLVVAALSRDKPLPWLLGSVAERVAQLSRAPVLVVRDAARLEAWARGERALRVVIGVERNAASRQALRFAARLRAAARCDCTVVQVVWPFGEHLRLGLAPPIPADHLRPDLEQPLVRDLRDFVGVLAGEGDTTLLVSPSYTRPDQHLIGIADERDADLLIIGSHQRAGVARLWQGSVSRAALHGAHGNVLTVPAAGAPVDARDLVRFTRVLVPTDFSPLAERAIANAYALVARGGLVHLLHVVPKGALGEMGPARARLLDRIPLAAGERGVHSEVEVVESDEPALAITQAAARVGAELICMTTHGRSGLARLALGSQAEAVLRRAQVPVLLLPAEHEGEPHG